MSDYKAIRDREIAIPKELHDRYRLIAKAEKESSVESVVVRLLIEYAVRYEPELSAALAAANTAYRKTLDESAETLEAKAPKVF